jgi:tetratricopeptide repeat protein
LNQEGHFAEAVSLAQRALTLREGALGPKHPDVATSLNNLAALYYSTGEYQKAARTSLLLGAVHRAGPRRAARAVTAARPGSNLSKEIAWRKWK